MKIKSLIFVFILIIFSSVTWAQLAMGKWQTHFAYNSVSQIAQSDTKIYAVSEGALFSVDKKDGEIEFYSKLNGLTGSNISQIEYSSLNQALVIVYSNGNIDLLKSGGITNIPDLYNKQMSSSKTVNQIQFYQNKAYLASDFGIVVLNLDKDEVADTYYIGPNAANEKVLNTTVNNGIIYALTASTIFQASIFNTQLVNYEFWSAATGLPGSGDFQEISTFKGHLILLRGGKLYKQETDNSWTQLLSSISPTNFNVSGSDLNVFASSSVYVADTLFNINTISNIGTITDAEYDTQSQTSYFAANSLGIISYKQVGSQSPEVNYYKPAGPAVNMPWDLTFMGKKLFMVPGGRWSTQNNTPGEIMMYENGIWTNIDYSTIQSQTGHSVTDFMNVAVDTTDPTHFFVTSYGTGLYEFKNNTFYKWYNYLNSTIQGHPLVPNDPNDYSRLDGAIFDKQGNLFFCNSGVSASIKVLLSNGTWTQLKYPNATQETLGKILINNQNTNQKWVLSVRSGTVIVFDDNGTITDQTDDKSVYFPSFNFPELDSNGNTVITSVYAGSVYSIAQDKNGVIWIGTEVGPFLFNNTSSVYNSDYTCSRIKIPRNDSTNLADYLLVDQAITAIAIDGANRKWLGTKRSGVYLMSENGQQTIQHFTASNSPLLSNNILSISINPVTGEVFFGTDQGLISYQSDASEAGSTFTNVHAYPNPVRQGYKGVITIAGLVENTQVKITDINGNLVCETVSNGSIATWDGKDVHGRRVSTGIYLAICANADGTQSTITKILVIN
ncbi:MAG: two-component regulator propeller domain-containing protein [Paludibacter sp.]|nr:two-component regulator propeller domain-containing protein [Paludibacter sp.]